jgi:hypothetical protein
MLPIKYVFFIKYVVSSNVFYEIIKHAVNSNLLGDINKNKQMLPSICYLALAFALK